jgi:hypothetical protein
MKNVEANLDIKVGLIFIGLITMLASLAVILFT